VRRAGWHSAYTPSATHSRPAALVAANREVLGEQLTAFADGLQVRLATSEWLSGSPVP